MIARSRAYVYIGAVVALIALGGWLYGAFGKRVESKALEQAGQHEQLGTAKAAEAAVHDQAAAAKQPGLQADAAAVARSRVEVARLRAAASRPAPLPPTPGVPEAEPAGAPLESPLEAAKDRLIDDLTKENADLKAQNAELTAGRDDHKAAEEQFQQESAALRIAIKAIPAPHTLALGLLAGTHNTLGVWGEKDFGSIRLGVDLVRRNLPSVNQTSVEADVRLGITLP